MAAELTIQYIYNSTFTIDYLDYFIVIDYFDGKLELPKDEDKKIIFIVTHSHADHYTPDIFTYPGSENALYVLSNDVEAPDYKDKVTVISKSEEEMENKKKAYDTSRVYRTGPNERFDFGGITFHTFGSTDQGISIYFEIYNMFFFHAGDLNAWKWSSFSEEEQAQEVADFQREINKIKSHDIDIAFGVLDPRLEENAYIGPDILIKELEPRLFIPMHFRDDLAITERYAKDRKDNIKTQIQSFRSQYEQLIIR